MGIGTTSAAEERARDAYFMTQALAQAELAYSQQEVPVGAVVVCDGKIIASGFNQPITSHNPCAHAEIVALQQAGEALGNYRLNECTLYVTLEPCSMCAGAIVHARIKRVVFATTEPKAGAVCSQQRFFKQPFINWQPEVEAGVLQDEAKAMLQRFFKERRALKKLT